MIWVLDHRRDLEADFRAFYHLSPKQALSLPGPEFMSLAYRSMVFPGVMSARASKIRETQTARNQGGTQRSVHDPSMSDLIEYEKR